MSGHRLRMGWTLLACAAIAALASAGLAQEEGGGTAAQPQALNPNRLSYQMKPVTGDVTNTDAQRINADADQDNWRLHGRTYDNQRFSPLTEINAANVKQLKPVALIQTGVANSMEATPIEIDGVLFVETAGNVVQAYDAVTGARELYGKRQAHITQTDYPYDSASSGNSVLQLNTHLMYYSVTIINHFAQPNNKRMDYETTFLRAMSKD